MTSQFQKFISLELPLGGKLLYLWEVADLGLFSVAVEAHCAYIYKLVLLNNSKARLH